MTKQISLARVARLFFILGLTAYVGLCVFMAITQRSFIYHPQAYNPQEVDRMAQFAGLERWTNSAGENIGFKSRSIKQPSQGSVMVMYGNGSIATGSAHYANDIQAVAPLDVYILEYPGYEDRPGPPTQDGLFAAASNGFQMIPTNKPVYLVGESLGSGVASYLMGTYTNRIAGVVLISPFNRLAAVGQNHFPMLPVSLLLVDRFPSEDFLRNYRGKVGVTVDGRDDVVPEEFGLRLYNSYNGPKKLWQFPTGGHCQITEAATDFWAEAIAFWRTH